jgi:glutaredoxin
MADTQGTLSKKIGVLIKDKAVARVIGTPRCERHAIYLEDGVIKAFEVAASPDDPTGDAHPEVSMVDHMLTKVPDLIEDKEATLQKLEEEKKQDKDAITKVISKHDLVLAIKPGCPFCKDALDSLQDNGFNPRVVEINRSEKRGAQELTGVTSVPYAFAKGKYLGGCNDGPEAWMGVKALLAKGELSSHLK